MTATADPPAFKPGDKVVTAIGRVAIIRELREDGLLEANYVNEHPTLSEVILVPAHLKLLS